GCVAGAWAGTCDGASGNRTDVLTIVTTVGTTNIGPFTVNSNCGAGGTNYTYWARWVVSGAYIPPDYNDDMCNFGNLGTHNFNTTQTLAGQLNTSPCDGCQGGEPNCSS